MKRKKAIAIWIVIVLLINILPFSSAYAENSNEVDVLAVVTNSAESEAESLEVNAEEYFAQDGVDSLEFSGDDERSPVEDKQGEDESVIHQEQGAENTDENATAQNDEQTTTESEKENELETSEPLENEDISDAAEEKAPNNEAEAFCERVSVNGVTITVYAEAGVFPEGAVLHAEKVPGSSLSGIDAAVEEQRSRNENVAASYTFDIKVLDTEGNELQPADSANVRVSFSLPEVANENLKTQVYHIEDKGAEVFAQPLEVETNSETATVTTEGFSCYTVEFTYGDKQYVLYNEDSPIELCTILNAVGLTGTINSVSVSDESLIGIVRDEETDTWLIYTLKPFETEEWLKAVIDDVEYEITLTDAIIPDGGSGSNNRIFARSADMATVTIDPSKLTKEFVDLSKSNFSTGITYSNGKVIADLGSVDLDYEKVFDGFTIVFTDAVIMSDGSREDLIFSVGSITVAGRDNKLNPSYESWPHNETILLLNLDYNQGNSYPSIVAQGSATYTMGSKEYGYNQGFRMDDACLKIEGKDSTHSYSEVVNS